MTELNGNVMRTIDYSVSFTLAVYSINISFYGKTTPISAKEPTTLIKDVTVSNFTFITSTDLNFYSDKITYIAIGM